MKLLFDDDLVEGVVILCVGGRRPGVPALQIRRFHAEREQVYALRDPDQRSAAFSRLHLAWFHEWDVDRVLGDLARQFPLLELRLETLGFRKARTRGDEAGELYVNDSGKCRGMVAVRLERFAQPDGLAGWMNHELLHLSDMVDPSFAYRPDLGDAAETESQRRLNRSRYRLLWAISVDGRLERAGRPAAASLAQRRLEFDRAFAFLPAAQRGEAFARLADNPAPCHRELAAMAADPRGLAGNPQPVPGAPCPLCGFATFQWADLDALRAETVHRIRNDLRGWTLTQGICFRCAEIYQALSSMELPATVVL